MPFTDSVRQFLRQHWLTLVATAIGLATSIFFYERSQLAPEPAFIPDPARTRIIDSSRAFTAPIRVLKRDGTQVRRDLTVVRFYFWNAGRASIRREHILKPLLISFADSTCQIVDFSLALVSRDVTRLTLRPDPGSQGPPRKLRLDFSILEQDDGAVGQIFYEGDPQAELAIEGVLEGVRQITTPATLPTTATLARAILGIGKFALGVILLVLAIGVLATVEYYLPKLIPARVVKGIAGVLVVLFALALVYAVIDALVNPSRATRTATLLEMVPASLRMIR